MSTATAFTPAPIPDGIIDVQGSPYMKNPTGGLHPVEAIPPVKKLMDETVRREFGWAQALSEQLRRFRNHLMFNLDAFDDLVSQEYGVSIGGPKGNRSYTSFDGLWKIEVRMQDRIAYGPEMQAAKALFDECIHEWSSETRAEMRSIVTNAFNIDREGQISRAAIAALLRTESEDSRWLRGQDAIRDAAYVMGAKEYVRFSFRNSHRDGWEPLTINLANA
ncbi:DUF3164 family protein [Salipiger marinus]|uniref:DUF3164 family protein n=1 Tax=Salipiger marinus TaxID=555512 RepID=UPI002CDAA0A1|nr:DUF3164 family protein [Salipiger manganoxidans]MEB3417577.1 DUF3164 family protein [Salipiger manganoxidans]